MHQSHEFQETFSRRWLGVEGYLRLVELVKKFTPDTRLSVNGQNLGSSTVAERSTRITNSGYLLCIVIQLPW